MAVYTAQRNAILIFIKYRAGGEELQLTKSPGLMTANIRPTEIYLFQFVRSLISSGV